MKINYLQEGGKNFESTQFGKIVSKRQDAIDTFNKKTQANIHSLRQNAQQRQIRNKAHKLTDIGRRITINQNFPVFAAEAEKAGIADLQDQLYKEEYFGNIPYEKAVDGFMGPLTQKATQRAKITVPQEPVDRLGRHTKECATFSNTWMRQNGLKASGDAYQVGNRYTPVINGYDAVPFFLPFATNKTIYNYDRKAADYVKQNLDTLKLKRGHMYPVNMYFIGSKHTKDFYRKALAEKTGTVGTHTGVLYNNGNQWMVAHNIHGTIHDDPVSNTLGGLSNPNKYGITAIFDAGKKSPKDE